MNTTVESISSSLMSTPTPGCPSEEYLHTYFLVFSNLFMLFPIFYCIINGPKKYSLELANMIIVMVNSMFYHMCDENDCTRYCLYPWTMAYYIDFTFSYNLIPTMLFYLVEIQFTWRKVLMHAVVLLTNFILVVSYKGQIGTKDYFMVVTSVVIAFVTYHLYSLWRKGELKHEFTHHFDWMDGIAAATFAVIGVGFKIADYEDYWLYHSMWHASIMLSIYFTMEIYDLNRSCFCITRNRICTMCTYYKIHGRYPNNDHVGTAMDNV